MIIQLRRGAKELESKQSKDVGAKFLQYKPYINGKIEVNTKNYLFMQKYKQYIKNEQNLIDQENINRKIKMKQISNEEIEEFNNIMDKKREEKQLMLDKKTEKLLEDWNERKKTIPAYVSPLSENAYIEITKKKKEVEDTKDKQKEVRKRQEDYANDVKQPQINKDLEQKRLELIMKLKKIIILYQKKQKIIKKKKK